MIVRAKIASWAFVAALALATSWTSVEGREMNRPFNGAYTGSQLNRVAFPIGGIGAGMYCLEGTGAISHMSVRHHLEFTNAPLAFAAVCVLGDSPEKNVARVIEGPMPDWKYFGRPNAAAGLGRDNAYGFPHFRECIFAARFPFATVSLRDPAVPLKVVITGWSPFTPPDADSSSLPVGALEYRFKNTSDKTQKAVFSFHAANFMRRGGGSIGPIEGGYVLYATDGKNRDRDGAFAFVVDGEKPVVDHCWFKGGWFDDAMIVWKQIQQGTLVDNPPTPGAAGASLGVPFELQPGEEKTFRLLTVWYVPQTNLRVGDPVGGPAFGDAPSRGPAEGQNPVSGFLGKGLVNTFDPGGDTAAGTLTSPEFKAAKRYLHFLVGGGSYAGKTCVELLVDGKVVDSATGKNSEKLEPATFDLGDLRGKKVQIRVADRHTGDWGHVLADRFVLSDKPTLGEEDANQVVLQDFEANTYGDWEKTGLPPASNTCTCGDPSVCVTSSTPAPKTYVPWYATKYKNIEEVVADWRTHYDELRRQSQLFADAFYDTTLPPEVIEAVAANLTILKTPTILRQHDGRLWCWEGCCDNVGCCAGSCTHVWNYAQALCHLFPSLERGLRQNEYFEGQNESGRQAFRGNLPVTPGGYAFDASDGQLGGIMKAHREWRVSGNKQWLGAYWPRIKASLNYMIEKWDPRHTGLLEEEHHNTYDINYFGPDGHCGSFYLGALAAAIKMGEAMDDDVSLYRELLAKGRKRMETELYNDEYFIQIVTKDGLNHNFRPLDPNRQSPAYRRVAEQVNEQGPLYQYGTGCLSDGVLGLWMARVCGLEDEIVDTEKVRSHLLAVHKYNLKHDLAEHGNAQRPTFAMGDDGGLLLCSWPRGNKPYLPFVYSDEVWTGIEYQVASHLMLLGQVEEGLDVVRECRKRYDGVRRNPFDEYECGHWYARAMSAYGLLEGLTGVRYDAATKTLYVDSKIGDFRGFLSTNTGYGTVTLKNGEVMLDVKSGVIPVEKTVVKK
ncbi:MAG TPA: GH116 family glycosyl hydrolase [Thermoguttaceae bacterium]|nr:GH116 family glycosyl hydrolase [Thermoguttaceae bacterium]